MTLYAGHMLSSCLSRLLLAVSGENVQTGWPCHGKISSNLMSSRIPGKGEMTVDVV